MSRCRASLGLLALLVSGPASAHEQASAEKALLQLRAEQTQLLLELSFPEAPEAARWRIRADLDRNGRLTPDEYGLLARSLAVEASRRIRFRIDGAEFPWKVRDAKVTNGGDGDGLSGRLQALVFLEAREVPPGVRKVEVSVEPMVRRDRAVELAIESPVGPLRSLTGGRPIPGRAEAVGLAPKERCTFVVDVAKPPHTAR